MFRSVPSILIMASHIKNYQMGHMIEDQLDRNHSKDCGNDSSNRHESGDTVIKNMYVLTEQN